MYQGRARLMKRSMSFHLVDPMMSMMSLRSQSEAMAFAGKSYSIKRNGNGTERSFTAENYAISYPFTFFDSGWYMLIINQTMLKPSIASPFFSPVSQS